MVPKEMMLKIAYALARAVRHNVPFSDNLESIWWNKQLIKQHPDENCPVNDRTWLLKRNEIIIKRMRILDFTLKNTEYIFEILQYGAGRCLELSYLTGFLSECIESPDEEIYISIFSVSDLHMFCVLHQDKSFYDRRHKKDWDVANTFLDLSECFLDNAVLIDPWIYTVTPISHLVEHLVCADQYNVRSFYQNKIIFSATVKLGVNHAKRLPEEMRKIFSDYHFYYKKSLNQNITASYGQTYTTIAEKLDRFAPYWPKRLKWFNHLQAFLIQISQARSAFYSLPGMKSDKYSCFSKVIQFIQSCIDRFDSDSLVQLKVIVDNFLRITLLIQAPKTPAVVNASNLVMTHTGKALFNYLRKTRSPYLFEEILDLNALKQAAQSHHNEREAYVALCRELHEDNVKRFIALGGRKDVLPAPPNLFAFDYRLHQRDSAWFTRAYTFRQTHPARSENPTENWLVYLYCPDYAQFCYQQLRNLLRWADPQDSEEEDALMSD